MSDCIRCKKVLSFNEIGIFKKLINRSSTEFMCRECLAHELKVLPECIDEKIKQFIEQGCTLFSDD